MKALFIAPSDFRVQIGGSSNRMLQTHSLLEEAGFQVDVVIVGSDRLSNIPIKIDWKCAGSNEIKIDQEYDLVFCNYIFLLELIQLAKPTPLFCDIHDDLIDRNVRLGANWITRTKSEVEKVLSRSKASLIHISATEFKFYSKMFPRTKHYWLPYKPQGQAKKTTSKVPQFDFGFIGTQNSINAKALIGLSNLTKALPHRSILVAGPIVEGIKTHPKNFTLKTKVNISDFYDSIKTLVCPVFDQSGASTKIVEAFDCECSVLTSQSLMDGIGIKSPLKFPSNFKEFGIELTHPTELRSTQYQRRIYKDFVERYLMLKTQLLCEFC